MNESLKASSARSPRRYDPDRRDKIIEAALKTIAEHGVSGTNLRQVAALADVPLGSLSYHFSGRDELLLEAFNRFALRMAQHFEDKLSRADSRNDVVNVVIDHICGQGWASRESLLLSYELYAFASRADAAMTILRAWLERVRELLQMHFDKLTADALDALIEGYSIHRSFDRNPPSLEDIAAIVARVIS